MHSNCIFGFIAIVRRNYVEEEESLKSRIETTVVVVGIQKLHVFIDLNKGKKSKQKHSLSDSTKTHKVQISPQDEDILFEEIVGHVACAYGNEWWMKIVLSKQRFPTCGTHTPG
ncbi:hypothetical protein AVEN_123513-1 [Araneus ventricosus]|uniref:Uncharacterized protein n=1 Tax=Araneus ventricosus TaxID=182803 RepID=A0A4Y2GP03_ARAVE|nr:hypothetical protein AVEN_123513-1 [Araneus ventricosus]